MNNNIIGKKCYELWFNVIDELPHWSMSEYTVNDVSFKGAIRLKEEDPEDSWIYPNNGFYKAMSDVQDGKNEEYPTFFWDKDEAQRMLDHLNSIGYIGVGFR